MNYELFVTIEVGNNCGNEGLLNWSLMVILNSESISILGLNLKIGLSCHVLRDMEGNINENTDEINI